LMMEAERAIGTLNTILFFSFLGVGWDGVYLVCRSLTGLLHQPRMINDECGAVGGMRIGRRNRSTRRKPAPVSLCPPQIPHDLTRAAAVGNPATKRLSDGTASRWILPPSSHGWSPEQTSLY
jgi:hypothetical protein